MHKINKLKILAALLAVTAVVSGETENGHWVVTGQHTGAENCSNTVWGCMGGCETWVDFTCESGAAGPCYVGDTMSHQENNVACEYTWYGMCECPSLD